MNTNKNLVFELEKRKILIVRFIINLIVSLGLLAIVLYVVVYIFHPDHFCSIWVKIGCALNILFVLLLIYTKRFIIQKSIKTAFLIPLVFLFAFSILIISLSGTSFSLSYILIATIIFVSSIVLSIKKTNLIFILFCILTIIVYLLHTFEILEYQPSLTSSNLPNTAISLFFLWIINHVVRIGYGQIEHSYQKASEYSRKLEKLNKQLDSKVKLRTRQLEKSFEEQVKSVQCSAVLGDITKPLLHDLATPVTSVKGTVSLIDGEKINKSVKEYLDIIKVSVDQMERTINNARYFMKKKDMVSDFSPEAVISNILLILQSELTRNNIKISINIPAVKINGVVNLFERVVINILLNAIEELRNTDKKREITIHGQKMRSYFVLKIHDTGRGIRKEFLKKLFSPDFTLKSDDGHLGMGLPFVKSVVEKNFKGKISVASKVGEYTEFIIKFNLHKDVGKG